MADRERAKKWNRRGTAAVEFALILPVLVVLVFGIIEFGLLLYDKQVITNASREGARFGVEQAPTRPDLTAITGVVNNYTSSYLVTFASGAVTPDVSAPSGTCPSVSPESCKTDPTTCPLLTVAVTYQYTFLVLGNLGFTGPLLTANTTMRCE